MQKSIFQKAMLTVILVPLLAICFHILSKAGIQPLWAAITVVFLRGFVRCVYRIIIMPVSIAIVISLLLLLICL